jgi:hypothetical protein
MASGGLAQAHAGTLEATRLAALLEAAAVRARTSSLHLRVLQVWLGSGSSDPARR